MIKIAFFELGSKARHIRSGGAYGQVRKWEFYPLPRGSLTGKLLSVANTFSLAPCLKVQSLQAFRRN
jgi:hypothetical protein